MQENLTLSRLHVNNKYAEQSAHLGCLVSIFVNIRFLQSMLSKLVST